MKMIKRIVNNKYFEGLCLAGLMVLGISVRLFKVDNPIADWHSWRQADTASVSKVYVQDGVDFLYPRYHDVSTIQTGYFNPEGYRFVELPIYNAMHAWASSVVTGVSFDTVGRMISIVLAVLSSYVVFLVGKRFIDEYGGLVACGVFLFLPYNIYFTRVILPEPLGVLFALLALWFFILHVDRNKTNYLIFSSIAFSLALLIKPYIFFYGIPMLYLAVNKYGIKKILKSKKYYFALLLVIAPVLFWRLWVSNFPEGIPYWKWAFNGNHIRFRPSFWYWIFGERIGKMILGVWGLIPFYFSLVSYKKGKAFIQSLILGIFVYVSVVASANVMHDYYQSLIIPMISLALAAGIVYMWEAGSWVSARINRGILIFSLGVAFVVGWIQIKEFYNINNPPIIEAGVALQEIAPEDAWVIAPYNGDTAFLYQTGRWGWPFRDRSLDQLISEGADYFVSVNYDDQTNEAMSLYESAIKTPDYVIIDLHKPLK